MQASAVSTRKQAFVSHDISHSISEALFLLTVIASGAANAQAVSIFSSTDMEGKTSWSTQALDNTYVQIASLSTLPVDNTGVLTAQTQPVSVNQAIAKRRDIWQSLVNSTALRYGVEARLITALIEVESAFNPNAVSPKGAIGLMQLMPATASRYGMRDKRELFEPARNLDIGVRHLKDLLTLHDGNAALAMASYNAGSGAVAKHGQRIPRFNETMLYVPAVLAVASRIPITSKP